jgi:16S rRNA C1402 (ribose-2'-O) methylase RsmI
MSDADAPLISDLGAKFAKANLNVANLVQLVAGSPAMTQRRAE